MAERGDSGADPSSAPFPTGLVGLALRVWAAAKRAHFRIPRRGFLFAALVGAAVLVFEPYEADVGRVPLLIVGWMAVAIGAAGLLRWWRVSRPRPVLALCRFTGDEPRAREIQRRILTDLSDKLPPRYRVVAVPEAVGTDQRSLAATLRRRVRALYLVYGSIRRTGEVDPRMLRAAHRYLIHEDHHTRDRYPQRTAWRVIFDRLTGVRDADEVEYPFTSETEAVVRGIEGRVLLVADRPQQAERALKESIALSGESPSHAVDDLRIALAEALDATHQHAEAVELLRSRAAEEHPSPDLLRTLVSWLIRGLESPPDDEREEAIALLRRAAEHRGDPQRDVTLYNLAMLLRRQEETREEGEEILKDLATFKGSHYARAWYIARESGGEAFHRFQELNQRGEPEEAIKAAKESARWYSRMIRRRPRLYLSRSGPRPWNVRLGPEPSPILIANLLDAHRAAGHRSRVGLWEWRLRRVRRRFMRLARRWASKDDWLGAYKYLEWMRVGRGDEADLVSRVGAAVAAEQAGRSDLAAARWAEARTLESHDDQLQLYRQQLEAWLAV